MEEKRYSVSEAVRLVGVEPHVLRYWEEELSLEIRRSAQGHRIYSAENIETFRQVRELKDKGLQLKAIRLLLDKQGRLDLDAPEQDAGFARQIRGLTGEDETDCAAASPEAPCTEIVPIYEPEPVQQFEQILRRLMEEVVSEQNEKLEESIAERIREELTELYLQYDRSAREAAATLETQDGRIGGLRRAMRRLFRKDRE